MRNPIKYIGDFIETLFTNILMSIWLGLIFIVMCLAMPFALLEAVFFGHSSILISLSNGMRHMATDEETL